MTINATPELVELELTHACQLAWTHCLTSSHPGAGHGTMTLEDWQSAIRPPPSPRRGVLPLSPDMSAPRRGSAGRTRAYPSQSTGRS